MEKETIYSDMNANSISLISYADGKELNYQLDTCIHAWLDGNIQHDGKPFPNIVNVGVFRNMDELVEAINQCKSATGLAFEMTGLTEREIFEGIVKKYEKHERFKKLDTDGDGHLIGIYTYQEKDQK